MSVERNFIDKSVSRENKRLAEFGTAEERHLFALMRLKHSPRVSIETFNLYDEVIAFELIVERLVELGELPDIQLSNTDDFIEEMLVQLDIKTLTNLTDEQRREVYNYILEWYDDQDINGLLNL